MTPTSPSTSYVSVGFRFMFPHTKQDREGDEIGIKNSPSFTGKERDSESRLYYFGARYHDPALLTSFLSVDPKSDKYPNLSPYAYCAWTRPTGGHEHLLIKFNLVNNPLKLVDPNGRDTIRLDLSSGNISRTKADGNHSVEYYRNGQNVGFLEIDKDKCEFGSSTLILPSEDGDVAQCTTQYINIGNQTVGEEIFKKVSDWGSDVEWDYYSIKQGEYGELSTSSQPDKMVHPSNKHIYETVSLWRHYHPQNSSDSQYPSYSDQGHARTLGVPCYIHSQSKSMRFDNILPKQGHITISQFNSLWNRFAR